MIGFVLLSMFGSHWDAMELVSLVSVHVDNDNYVRSGD